MTRPNAKTTQPKKTQPGALAGAALEGLNKDKATLPTKEEEMQTQPSTTELKPKRGRPRKASTVFGAWLEEQIQRGCSVGEIAHALGVSESILNHYARGDARPTLEGMDEIDRYTHGRVSFRDWLKK